jgi:hypothetical protein
MSGVWTTDDRGGAFDSRRYAEGTRAPSSGEILGSLIFLAGAAGGLYFFRFFDVSLPGREIVNLELMSDREHGMIASAVAVVVGIGLALATRRKR